MSTQTLTASPRLDFDGLAYDGRQCYLPEDAAPIMHDELAGLERFSVDLNAKGPVASPGTVKIIDI